MDNAFLQEVALYVAESVEMYNERRKAAFAYMDLCRCPLAMADESLYNDVFNAVDDFLFDSKVTDDEIEEIFDFLGY